MEIIVQNSSGNSFFVSENIWSGRISITVDGKLSRKIRRNHYQYADDANTFQIEKKGNSLLGMQLLVNGEEIEVVRKLNTLEIILSCLPLILVLIGGFIGGALGVITAIINAFMMRKFNNVIIKIGASLVLDVVAFIIYLRIAVALLSSL